MTEVVQVISSDPRTTVVEIDGQTVAVVTTPAASPAVIVEALRGEPGPPGGSLRVTAVTSDATSVLVGGLATLPAATSACRITGQVVAQDTASGDCAIWDIAAAAKCAAPGAALAWVGLPYATPFAGDPSMAGCGLAWSLGADGPVLLLTGLADRSLAWTAGFSVTVTGVPA